MSYMLDLDEYDEQRLLNELIGRMENRVNGCCDYCHKEYDKPWEVTRTVTLYGADLKVTKPVTSCKMYARHRGELADNVPELQARLLRLIEEEMARG